MPDEFNFSGNMRNSIVNIGGSITNSTIITGGGNTVDSPLDTLNTRLSRISSKMEGITPGLFPDLLSKGGKAPFNSYIITLHALVDLWKTGKLPFNVVNDYTTAVSLVLSEMRWTEKKHQCDLEGMQEYLTGLAKAGAALGENISTLLDEKLVKPDEFLAICRSWALVAAERFPNV